MIGAAAHIGEATVPNAEVFVALSVVALGLIVFRKTPLRRDVALALFAAAGLINGYALGETIAGAERTPILAYLIGLAAIQMRDRARGDVRRAGAGAARARCNSWRCG